MKILFAVSEAVPFIKTGGLADVAGSLPKALKEQGAEVVVILPKYHSIPENYRREMEHVYDGELTLAWRKKYIGLDKLEKDGITYFFVDNEDYFRRENLYGYNDDGERFAFFSRAVLSLLPAMDFWPDIIQHNDWHTALISAYLKLDFAQDERYRGIKTLFTIHNLKYQGIFPDWMTTDTLGLARSHFDNGTLEQDGALNYMKAAIVTADRVSTVSRSYAEEIQYSFYGEGLDSLLRRHKNILSGIVNGLDYDLYNPLTDKEIFFNYDAATLDKKLDNKIELQKQLGLKESRQTPLLAIVSRLVEAKGLDLCRRILDEIFMREDIQLAVLGTGDSIYEGWFRGLAWRYPRKVSVTIGFSNQLAQRIYAAADLFLMPSRYEPCGIGQLIAMRYGAIPVVRATGGLRDTVIPFNKANRTGTGFLFENYNAHDFKNAIERGLSLHENFELWNHIVKNAMEADFSWKKSAADYISLFESMME